jgi:hypothetical protein
LAAPHVALLVRATLALADSAIEPHIVTKWIGLSRSASWLWVTGAFRFLGEDFQTVADRVALAVLLRILGETGDVRSSVDAKGNVMWKLRALARRNPI